MNKCFRDFFALPPIKNLKIHFWLYKPEEIKFMLNNAKFSVINDYPYSIAPGIFSDISLARKIPKKNSYYLKSDKNPDLYLNIIGKVLYKIGKLIPGLFELNYGFICKK